MKRLISLLLILPFALNTMQPPEKEILEQKTQIKAQKPTEPISMLYSLLNNGVTLSIQDDKEIIIFPDHSDPQKKYYIEKEQLITLLTVLMQKMGNYLGSIELARFHSMTLPEKKKFILSQSEFPNYSQVIKDLLCAQLMSVMRLWDFHNRESCDYRKSNSFERTKAIAMFILNTAILNAQKKEYTSIKDKLLNDLQESQQNETK